MIGVGGRGPARSTLGQHPSMPRCLADETLALGSLLPRSVGPHSIGTAEAAHRVGPSAGMSFRLSFHLALLSPTGAHWLDRPPDTSCKDSTRRYAVDDPRLSCKQQVGGSSPPPTPNTAGHRLSWSHLAVTRQRPPPLPHRTEFMQPPRSGQARVRTAASSFRCSREIVVSRSVPSCSPTGRRILGS